MFLYFRPILYFSDHNVPPKFLSMNTILNPFLLVTFAIRPTRHETLRVKSFHLKAGLLDDVLPYKVPGNLSNFLVSIYAHVYLFL